MKSTCDDITNPINQSWETVRASEYSPVLHVSKEYHVLYRLDHQDIWDLVDELLRHHKI